MTKSAKVAILILHFRDSLHTQPCLDSLQLAYPHFQFNTYIISVQSQHVDQLSAPKLHPQIIEENRNLGFAWANNMLIKQAIRDGCDHFVLLNNDTTVDEHYLSPLIDSLKDSSIGMVCPKIYFFPGNEFHHDDYTTKDRGKVIWYAGGLIDWANVYGSHQGVNEIDHGQWPQTYSTDLATGCCIGITRKTIEKIGFMDESYFLYYEDADWSMKATNHGLKIMVNPESIIWHKNAGSTGGPGSDLHMYYQNRNRIYFGLKFAPLRTKFHLIKNAFKDLKNANPTIRQASKDALLGKMGFRQIT